MEGLIYLDTHVVAFLYEDAGASLPPVSRSLIAENELLLSPVVILELQYLFEIETTLITKDRVIREHYERAIWARSRSL